MTSCPILAKGAIALTLFALVISGCASTKPQEEFAPMLPLIPSPLSGARSQGVFELKSTTVVIVPRGDQECLRVAGMFTERIQRSTGGMLVRNNQTGREAADGTVSFSIDPNLPVDSKEGYALSVSPGRVLVTGKSGAGLFYGMESLLQLCPASVYRQDASAQLPLSIQCAEIKDSPRFPWRGMHLDVSRHFFPVAFIKQYIDLLAQMKMNTFHWHLTDDQGWRFESKKYPKLTTVGAWRADRESDDWDKRKPQQAGEAATYGGFYTQEEMREIVAYARDRYITVLPEIEMPAHAIAALAAYPEYSCTGGPFTVVPGGIWPISDIFCAGNDSTFEFLNAVLDEVFEIFPSAVVHIGGDEADKARWKKCPKCQARIRNEHLQNEEELQSYFVRRIEQHVNAKGKAIIGWDEILQGGLAPNALVMSWRGMKGGIESVRQGHDVVMTPTDFCYFDYYQAKQGEPRAIGGYLPLSRVYQFEPAPDSLSEQQRRHILGGQGNLWTEFVPTPQHAQYMVLPRMAAMAEVLWTARDKRSYDDFLLRLNAQYSRYREAGVSFRDSGKNPE
jgi:hexosaminidase